VAVWFIGKLASAVQCRAMFSYDAGGGSERRGVRTRKPARQRRGRWLKRQVSEGEEADGAELSGRKRGQSPSDEQRGKSGSAVKSV
jgi:hypothetical protein